MILRWICLAAAAFAQTPATEVQVATTVAFTEGPAVGQDGSVYFTETTFKRILKLSPEGKLSVFRENSNGANGLLFDKEWRLIACETGRVTRSDLSTGRIEVLAETWQDQKFTAPNDVTMDNQGRLYFTDLPGGGVYRIDAPGKVARILARPDIQRPNGLSISPDDRTLYLVEANQAEGGARLIRAYDLQPNGTVRNMRVHYNFYPGRSADGMTIDTQGNLYAAAGLHRRRNSTETLDTKCGVHVVSPQGKLIDFIPIPEDTITNCAFGGDDMKTLYVTAGKTLFKFRTKIAGTRR